MSNNSYYVGRENLNSYSATLISIAYFVVLLTAFFAGFGVIWAKQRNGMYLCQQIFSQFSDEELPTLGTYTGLFYKHPTAKFGGRSCYRNYKGNLDDAERGRKDQEQGPLLAYCESETNPRWTLSVTKDKVNADKWDPCKDWLAASSESKSFDLLSTTSSPWVINTENRAAPLTHHFLACYECTHVKNFCKGSGECKEDGDYDRCDCKGRYGLRCEYSDPCKTMEVSQRNEGFPKGKIGQFAFEYDRLEDAKIYDLPVYTHTSLGDGNDTDFIMFTGERWIMSTLNGTDKDPKDVLSYVSELRNSEFEAEYKSEFVYFADVLGADQKASPIDLKWRRSSDEASIQPQRTGFFCASTECDDKTDPCRYGECDNGICVCSIGFSGSRCQIPPDSFSDGHCDKDYNQFDYDYDGGDCCDNRCRSTQNNICGKEGLGYIDIGYHPYPQCGLRNQWNLSADPIYGGGQAVALSGNGKVLAVAEPGLVRLFDKDGAEWKQRGKDIQGNSDSNFGVAISLSGESFNVANNPRTSATVTLGVGAPNAGLVRLFTCSTGGCIRKGGDIFGGLRFGSSLSISEDGESVAIGGAGRELVEQAATSSGEVKVFTWSNNTWNERGFVPIDMLSSRKLSASGQIRLNGYYVSLSGDYLAVGALESNNTAYESTDLITQVFKWNNKTGWNLLGDEIRREFYASGTPWPLKSVVIKGSILAIGYHSSVDVLEWNETSKNWTIRDELEVGAPAALVG